MVELKYKTFISIKPLKVKAFTLFESVVAISIITILIGLSAMIYANIVRSENPLAYYQAKDQIDVELDKLITERVFINKNTSFENFEIEQEISAYQGSISLFKVVFIAKSGGLEILRENHLIAND
jgi:hypothetical protein